MKKNIAILFGGKSSEYEVSLSSAYGLLSNIDREKYELYTIGITREGKWLLFSGDIEKIRSDEWYMNTEENRPVLFSPDNGDGGLIIDEDVGFRKVKIDAVFPMIHGRFGEDGKIQGMFKIMGIPVVGCGCSSSAVCMDKDFTKSIVNEIGIRQARSITLRKFDLDNIEAVLSSIKDKLGFPVFVKPASSGSSVGITKVWNEKEFSKAAEKAFEECDKLLVEEAICGIEAEVAILEENGSYTVSEPAEIDCGSSEFYDYETKYVSDSSSYYIPARMANDKICEIKLSAAKIFKALDCKGFARVDFFYTSDGKIVFNEINTIPGFTPISMYPKLIIHSGISYKNLIDRLIASAINVND